MFLLKLQKIFLLLKGKLGLKLRACEILLAFCFPVHGYIIYVCWNVMHVFVSWAKEFSFGFLVESGKPSGLSSFYLFQHFLSLFDLQLGREFPSL